MSKTQPLFVMHAAGRDDVPLVFVPLLVVMPALLFLLYRVRYAEEAIWPEMPWWMWPLVILVCLLFPVFAWLRARLTTRYTVYASTLMAEAGLFTRTSSEIRIADVRNITIRQSFVDRLVQTGDIAFSSSAGDGEEVVFRAISRPHQVKETIKELQDRARLALSDSAGLNKLTSPAPDRDTVNR